MTNLAVFAFEGQQVRFVGTAEQPEWVAADICHVLGLDTSLAVNGRPDRPNSGLDADEKGTAIVNTAGGNQEMLTVTEPGLYRLRWKTNQAEHNVCFSIHKVELTLRYKLLWQVKNVHSRLPAISNCYFLHDLCPRNIARVIIKPISCLSVKPCLLPKLITANTLSIYQFFNTISHHNNHAIAYIKIYLKLLLLCMLCHT